MRNAPCFCRKRRSVGADQSALAFGHVGLNYQDHVKPDPKFYRPAEVDLLLGDYSKARAAFGWTPTCSFEQLVHEMVDEDVRRVSTNPPLPRSTAPPK